MPGREMLSDMSRMGARLDLRRNGALRWSVGREGRQGREVSEKGTRGTPGHVPRCLGGPVQQSTLTPEFCCDVRPDRDRVVVRVAGELDMAVAPSVAAAVDELLEAGFARVVVDLRDLSFLDSAGVHMLVSAHHAAAQRTCELSLVRGPRNVQRVLELTAADSLFAFDEQGVGA